jgi:hypothetical protein
MYRLVYYCLMGNSCCWSQTLKGILTINTVYVVSVKDIRPDARCDKTVVHLFKDKDAAIAHIRDVEVSEIFPNYKGNAEVEYDEVKMIKQFEQGNSYICAETMFMLQRLPIE